jgi:hypothetical protein
VEKKRVGKARTHDGGWEEVVRKGVAYSYKDIGLMVVMNKLYFFIVYWTERDCELIPTERGQFHIDGKEAWENQQRRTIRSE